MSREITSAERPPQAMTALTALTTGLSPAVWGTTYLIASELLPDQRPLLAATIRALPVGLAIVAWSSRRPGGVWRPTGDWWWKAAVLGTLNIGLFFALLFVAAFRLPGGVAATAGAVQPLLAAAVAALVLGERFTARIALAGGAGVAGVALLVLGPEATLDPVGLAAALGGAASMAVGVVLTKHWGRPVGLLTFTGWQLTAGGLVLLPLALAIEGLPPALSTTNVVGFVWLAVIGTGLAYVNWFRGIAVLPVAAAGFLGLLSPLVATIAGWLVLGQRLTPVQLIGMLLVLAAVVAPQLADRPRSTTADRFGGWRFPTPVRPVMWWAGSPRSR
ncbi:MAG: EamA family transporter [Actinomycetota bacterium]